MHDGRSTNSHGMEKVTARDSAGGCLCFRRSRGLKIEICLGDLLASFGEVKPANKPPLWFVIELVYVGAAAHRLDPLVDWRRVALPTSPSAAEAKSTCRESSPTCWRSSRAMKSP